ncbi:two-component system sensor histidine kinase NtrB [Candidatus Electronema sp. TJ]|uniref:two-component system sensor histidine kinase NtrB n=1 Tax=Candidatus Electronema sp. TJ TaxID=3401573 RepID=UPI003AA7ED82
MAAAQHLPSTGLAEMKNRLISELSPRQSSGEQLRLHILWLLMIRVLLFTLLIAVTVVLQTKGRDIILPPPAVTMAFLSVVFIYSIGSAGLLQNMIKHLPRFGLLQLLSDAVFAALLVAGTGCSQSIFTPVFIFPVITGGMSLSRTGGLIAAAAASILYGGILACEYLGYIPLFYAQTRYVPPTDYLALTNVYSVYGITFFTIGLLSNLLAGRLRKTEEALSQTFVQFDRLNQLYKQVFDDIGTGIVTVDGRNRISSCNPAFERISGFSTAELLGLPFNSFFPAGMLTETDQSRQVADLQRKDGGMTRVRHTFAHLKLPPDPALNDPGGAQCKVITVQDVSLLEQMEQQMRNTEKLAAIGELSAAVAHDFRNPIAAISGSAQLLKNVHAADSSPDPLSRANRHLTEIIIRESARMEKTITDFLQFARPQALTLEWFDLRRLCEETIRQVKGKESCPLTAAMELDIPAHLDCWADRQLVQTLLTHLLENSCAAAAQTGQWPVLVRAREENGRNCVCLAVLDRGPGIAEELREVIFTPFFSTKANCAGLGLSIVRQLAEQHGGKVRLLEPEDGPGCVMEVCLPLPSLPDEY